MTDGIIQNVIRKYQSEPLYIIARRVRLEDLEQELIKNIDSLAGDLMLSPLQRHILIGDNKE